MPVFNDPAFDNHERILFCRDEPTGIFAIIALHSTALGPGVGGCRLWNYASEDEALHDALRLSKAMSYKNAMAGLKFGGGKAIVMKTPEFGGNDAAYERFGEFVESLNGSYVTAEDVGMTTGIMQVVARKTRHVSGLPPKQGKAGGDPGPKTAWGVYCGIEAAVASKLGRENLDGVRVAVQGLGHVGYYLCELLHQAGAIVLVADIDSERVQKVCSDFAAKAVGIDEVLYQDVDVVSPCALGAIINEQSIPKIKAPIVAGSANNQLETPIDGRRLADKDILYAPDYVINAGGVINIAGEHYGEWDDQAVMAHIAKIGPRLSEIFAEAKNTGQTTNEIADQWARELIQRAGTG